MLVTVVPDAMHRVADPLLQGDELVVDAAHVTGQVGDHALALDVDELEWSKATQRPCGPIGGEVALTPRPWPTFGAISCPGGGPIE